MDKTDKYAIITITHITLGQMDIRVSRDIPIKEIIRNLFEALAWEQNILNGYYAKSDRSKALLSPNDTLRDKEIYDGDILRIL